MWRSPAAGAWPGGASYGRWPEDGHEQSSSPSPAAWTCSPGTGSPAPSSALDALVGVSNVTTTRRSTAVRFFEAPTARLLEAGGRAGVRPGQAGRVMASGALLAAGEFQQGRQTLSQWLAEHDLLALCFVTSSRRAFSRMRTSWITLRAR